MNRATFIKQYLKNKGISQVWLAKKAEIKYERLRRVLSGQATLSADEYFSITKVLGI